VALPGGITPSFLYSEVSMDHSYRDHENKTGISERFQEETKYKPETICAHRLDWDQMPQPFKDCQGATEAIQLPSPAPAEPANIWEVFVDRRSERDYYSDRILPLNPLSSLLVATQGITHQEGNYGFRSAPSAGGLYPIESYLSVWAVEGLKQGVYHYRPHRFDLTAADKKSGLPLRKDNRPGAIRYKIR
jgi:hypothetical protein